MLYARVEHKGFVGVGIYIFLAVTIDSAALLDEAAQTDITRTLTRDWFYRRASYTGGWRVSVSPTLVELSVATSGPC